MYKRFDTKHIIEKIKSRGKLGSWFYAKKDLQELSDAQEAIRTAMSDTQFGVSVTTVMKVDERADELRSQVGDLQNLMKDIHTYDVNEPLCPFFSPFFFVIHLKCILSNNVI